MDGAVRRMRIFNSCCTSQTSFDWRLFLNLDIKLSRSAEGRNNNFGTRQEWNCEIANRRSTHDAAFATTHGTAALHSTAVHIYIHCMPCLPHFRCILNTSTLTYAAVSHDDFKRHVLLTVFYVACTFFRHHLQLFAFHPRYHTRSVHHSPEANNSANNS